MITQKKYLVLIRILFCLLIPSVIALIYCLWRGVTPFDLFLPASINSDCTYYYTLVNGTVHFGMPMGYFGYNESHAMVGTFAVWNPLILIPWSVFGVLFGWSFETALISNVIIFSIAFAWFAYLADADLKQILTIGLLLMLFPGFSIHLLNLLPEILLASFMVVYLGFALRIENRGYKRSGITAMYIIAFYLTAIRPFLIVLMILPSYYLIRNKKNRAVYYAIAALISVASLISFFLISRYFTCPYLEESFHLDLIKYLLHGQFKEAFSSVLSTLQTVGVDITWFMKKAFINGLTAGTQYDIAAVTTVFAVLFFLIKRCPYRAVSVTFAFSTVTAFLAILLFSQKVNEGGRHIFVFAIYGIILCSMIADNLLGILTKASLLFMLVFFIAKGALIPTDYDIPIGDEETREAVTYWNDLFASDAISLSSERGYDNTIIWASSESCILYGITSGMGISYCFRDYVLSNYDDLNCRYMLVDSSGDVFELCMDHHLRLIAKHGATALFSRY